MDMSGMTTSVVMAMSTATGTTTAAMAMAMSTTGEMAAASTTAMSDMSTTSVMDMTFFVSFTTPIFSTQWTPNTQGQYAGTCIFLIVLAVILRLLLALKSILEGRVWTDSLDQHALEHSEEDSREKGSTGLKSSVKEISNRRSRWRVNPAAGRATYEVVLVGVAYLLMIATMTMNVGYFLSVLGGVWLGTFILGSLASDSRSTC